MTAVIFKSASCNPWAEMMGDVIAVDAGNQSLISCPFGVKTLTGCSSKSRAVDRARPYVLTWAQSVAFAQGDNDPVLGCCGI
jgi:hypothetical protein